MRLLRETVFAYIAMGPKRSRWSYANMDDPAQPLAGEPIPEGLRRDLEVLRQYGYMVSYGRGYGCTSFWMLRSITPPITLEESST